MIKLPTMPHALLWMLVAALAVGCGSGGDSAPPDAPSSATGSDAAASTTDSASAGDPGATAATDEGDEPGVDDVADPPTQSDLGPADTGDELDDEGAALDADPGSDPGETSNDPGDAPQDPGTEPADGEATTDDGADPVDEGDDVPPDAGSEPTDTGDGEPQVPMPSRVSPQALDCLGDPTPTVESGISLRLNLYPTDLEDDGSVQDIFVEIFEPGAETASQTVVFPQTMDKIATIQSTDSAGWHGHLEVFEASGAYLRTFVRFPAGFRGSEPHLSLVSSAWLADLAGGAGVAAHEGLGVMVLSGHDCTDEGEIEGMTVRLRPAHADTRVVYIGDSGADHSATDTLGRGDILVLNVPTGDVTVDAWVLREEGADLTRVFDVTVPVQAGDVTQYTWDPF